MFHGYPKFYFQRGSTSDLKFVLQRMAVIPDNMKLEVSEEYERLFLAGGIEARKNANTYLNEIASKYRNKSHAVKDDILDRVNPLANAPKSTQEPQLNISDISAREIKLKPNKGFLDSLLDEVDVKTGRSSEK